MISLAGRDQRRVILGGRALDGGVQPGMLFREGAVGGAHRAHTRRAALADGRASEALGEQTRAQQRHPPAHVIQPGDVLVERGRAHIQPLGQAGQRQLLQPLGVGDFASGAQDHAIIQPRSMRHAVVALPRRLARNATTCGPTAPDASTCG